MIKFERLGLEQTIILTILTGTYLVLRSKSQIPRLVKAYFVESWPYKPVPILRVEFIHGLDPILELLPG